MNMRSPQRRRRGAALILVLIALAIGLLLLAVSSEPRERAGLLLASDLCANHSR